MRGTSGLTKRTTVGPRERLEAAKVAPRNVLDGNAVAQAALFAAFLPNDRSVQDMDLSLQQYPPSRIPSAGGLDARRAVSPHLPWVTLPMASRVLSGVAPRPYRPGRDVPVGDERGADPP